MAYELTGRIKLIQEPKTFDSGFTKREMVVIVEDGKYPQEINLEFVQDKTALLDAINETTTWLDANQTAEKEEFEEKQKALEAIAMPILQKMAGAGGAGGMPDMGGMGGGMPDMGGMGGAPADEDPAGGPTIEEID